MEDNPRVFQPGTVTIVVAEDSKSIYVGAVELTMVEFARTDFGEVELHMRSPSTEAETLRLDEEIRVARSLGFVKIRRH